MKISLAVERAASLHEWRYISCRDPRQGFRQSPGPRLFHKTYSKLLFHDLRARWKKLPDLMAYWRLSENVDLLWLLFPLLKSQPISWWVF